MINIMPSLSKPAFLTRTGAHAQRWESKIPSVVQPVAGRASCTACQDWTRQRLDLSIWVLLWGGWEVVSQTI